MQPLPSSLQPSHGVVAALRRFFHAEEVPFGLALVRIFFPLSLICAHLARHPHAREIFSLDGATAPLWNSYGYFHMLPEFSGEIVVLLHSALLFFLFTTIVGWHTRFSLIASTILFTYFNMVDCVSTIAKYSCIGTHTLLILSLSPCGKVWSIDAWMAGTGRRREDALPGEPSRAWPKYSMWTCRLLQFSIAFVYLGSAITKFKTPTFIGGEQLISWMLSHVNYEHQLGEFMAMNPALLVVAGFVTVIWEAAFIFTCWHGWGRTINLSFGVFFHVMTLVTLGLTIFPAVVIPIYCAFLYEDDFRRMAAWVRKVARRNRGRLDSLRFSWLKSPMPALRRMAVLPSPAAFALLTAAVAAGGVAAEHQLDPYGLRRPEGPHELKEIDPELVAKMLAPAPPIRDRDIFFTMDVGSSVVGGVILYHRDTFRPGDLITAQCMTVPPHGDLWVECNMHDAQDRLVDRAPVVINRETTRGTFTFTGTKRYGAGEYYLVLKRAGVEITRRKITMLPGPLDTAAVPSPVAQ